MSARPPAGRPHLLLGLAAVLVVALVARLARAGTAFQTGAFVPTDGDTLYHLRRMRLVLDGWPALPAVDPALAWPAGGAIPWAAGFDAVGALAMAAGVALLGPPGAWLGPAILHLLLGLLLVALTVELVLFLAPPSPARAPAALAAGLLAALLPQAAESTRLGLVDHHVIEALALLGLARWALVATPGDEATWRRRLGFEAAGAALSGGAVLCFTGSPLYVALVLPLLAAAVLAAERPRLVGSGAPGLLAGAALAAAGTAPLVAGHGRAFSFGYPSWWQPGLLALAAAALALAVLSARLAPARPRWRRPALLAALGLGALLATGLIVPRLASEGWAGLGGWLLRRDPWLAQVDEFQPLWKGTTSASLDAVRRFMGSLGLAFPLLLPLAALAVGAAGTGRMIAVAWLAGAPFALALLQARFGRVASPWVAAAAGLALAWLAGRASGRWPARPRLVGALPLAVAGLLAAVDPRLLAPLGREADPVPDGAVEAGLDLATWPVDPAAPGVLAPWDLGHHALVLGGRPVVAAGFGSYPDPAAFEDAERAFMVAEPALLELMSARRLGVVWAGATNLFGRVRGLTSLLPFDGAGFNPAWLAEVPSAPLLLGGSGVPALRVRHLEHLLPRFASTRAVVGLERSIPVLWAYQRVAGARLEGRAPPWTQVVLEIPLEEHGRRHTWRGFADAGEDGRWTATVPLPTDLATPTVRTAPGTVRDGAGPTRPLGIPLEAVLAGRRVEVAAAP